MIERIYCAPAPAKRLAAWGTLIFWGEAVLHLLGAA